MSFKNLEQRFNENVNTLYAGATTKFAGGSPSNGRSDDPLIVRRPGEGYWGAMEDRSIPVRSAQQDLRRLTLFQLRPNGIKFLAKQQLLQTGNTFKFTRIINPVFVVANAVPFLHVKRNLRPFSELSGKTDTSYENVRKMGTMQGESYDRLKKWKQPQFISTHLGKSRNNSPSSVLNRIGGIIGSVIKTAVGNKLSQAFSPIVNTISALNPTLKRNVGEEKKWSESRPELANNSVVQSVEAANVNYQVSMDAYFKTELKETTGTKFLKYFSSPSGIKTQTNRNDTQLKTVQGNQASIVNAFTGQSTKKISYVKDPANEVTKNFLNSAVYQPAYAPINSNFDDPISVSFAMGKHPPVRFRAFIKDLVETSNPQYQAFQYIGRIEKFINYTGVQRDISFKLAIIAFGQDELDMVWRRINYLTGLTFPYGFTRGIMQPNIVRLTLGGVYSDQPGYINSLTTNFNEPTETWDIDKDVPIGATMDMKFTLIEKATRVADSPFYGITDGDGRGDKNPMSGFSKQIPIPDPRLDSLDPMKIPTVGSITTKTEKRIPNLADSTRNLADVTRPDSFISSVIRNANLNTNIPTPVIRLNQPQITFPNNRLPGT